MLIWVDDTLLVANVTRTHARTRVTQTRHHDTHLRQLLGDVPAHKDSLQVDPQVLDSHPVLYDLSRVGQFVHPLLDGLLERLVVPGHNTTHSGWVSKVRESVVNE